MTSVFVRVGATRMAGFGHPNLAGTGDASGNGRG